MTATLALSSASVYINQTVVATLTVSNSDASSINMFVVTPYAYKTGDVAAHPAPCALGSLPLSAGTAITVPGSGSLVLKFNVIPFASTGSGTYSIGAHCGSSDGSRFKPTEATLTCLPFPTPESSNT